MRKFLLLTTTIFILSFSTPNGDAEKNITLAFTLEEVQIVYDALGNMPANKVEQLRMKILVETQRQLADTLKKK